MIGKTSTNTGSSTHATLRPSWRWVRYLCLMTIWTCGFAHSYAAEEATIQRAIDEYQAAMEAEDRQERIRGFERAELLFSQAIENGDLEGSRPSAALYNNLGNAALQATHIGSAIVAFRLATLVDPDNEQARQNLAYARGLVPNWCRYDDSDDLADSLFFWRKSVSHEYVSVLAAFVFLAAAGLLATGLLTGRPLFRGLAFATFGFWMLLIVPNYVFSDAPSDQAVIIADEVTLHSADSENSAAQLSEPVPDGAEVDLLQVRDTWSEIRIAGRTGWVRSVFLRTLRKV